MRSVSAAIVYVGVSATLGFAGAAQARPQPLCDVVVAGHNLPAADLANVEAAVNAGGASRRTVCLSGVFDFGDVGFVVINPDAGVTALAIVGLNDGSGKASIRNGSEPLRFWPTSTLPELRISNLRFEQPSFAAIAIFRGNQLVEISDVNVDGVRPLFIAPFGIALREGIVLTSAFAEIAGEVVIRDNVISAGTYNAADPDQVATRANFGILAAGAGPVNPFPMTAALTIERNEVLNWAGSGIAVVGADAAVIEHNDIRPGPVALELPNPDICVANGILLDNTTSSHVRYNVIEKDLARTLVSNASPICSAGVVLQSHVPGLNPPPFRRSASSRSDPIGVFDLQRTCD